MFPFERKVPILQPFDSLFQQNMEHMQHNQMAFVNQFQPQFQPHQMYQPRQIAMDEEIERNQDKIERYPQIPYDIIHEQKQQSKQIIDQETLVGMETNQTRNGIFIRKLNVCILYFLANDCNGYKIVVQKNHITNSNFLYIDKLMKDDVVLFDVQNVEKEANALADKHRRYHLRKEQCFAVAKAMENETGVTFTFKGEARNFEFVSLVDKDENGVNLIDFFNKYYNFKELSSILRRMNGFSGINLTPLPSFQMSGNPDERRETNRLPLDEMHQMVEQRKKPKETKSKDSSTISRWKEDKTLTMLNNTLLSIMNKLHYVMSFCKPKSFDNYLFLYINTIRKEFDQCCLYDKSLKEKQYLTDDVSKVCEKWIKHKTHKHLPIFLKCSQIESMMQIIENETNIAFYFNVHQIKQEVKDIEKQWKIKVNDKLITFEEFFKQYNDNTISQTIIYHFKQNITSELYQMNSFLPKSEDDIQLKDKQLWKTNDEKIIDEWNRVFIYILFTLKYKIKFQSSPKKYLSVIKQLQCNEIIQSIVSSEVRDQGTLVPTDVIEKTEEEFLQNYKLSSYPTKEFLYVSSIEKNGEIIKFSRSKEKQIRQMIEIIDRESKYLVVLTPSNNQQTIPIPHFLTSKQLNKLGVNEIYESDLFIKYFNVNYAIEEMINTRYPKFGELKFDETFFNLKKEEIDYELKKSIKRKFTPFSYHIQPIPDSLPSPNEFIIFKKNTDESNSSLNKNSTNEKNTSKDSNEDLYDELPPSIVPSLPTRIPEQNIQSKPVQEQRNNNNNAFELFDNQSSVPLLSLSQFFSDN